MQWDERLWFQSRPPDVLEAGMGCADGDHISVPSPAAPLTWVMPAQTEMLEAVEAVSSKEGEAGLVDTLANLRRIAPGRVVGLLAGTRAPSNAGRAAFAHRWVHDPVSVDGALGTAEWLEDVLGRSSDVIARWLPPRRSTSIVAWYGKLSPPTSRPLPRGHVALLLRLWA